MVQIINKNKLRYGLIGCGRISLSHMNALMENKDEIELVCLVDINIENAKALLVKSKIGDIFKEINIYKTHQEMIEKENLDLVAITTESGSHASIVIDCLNKGINVIVEKPMALSIEDADKMIEAAELNGVKLCVSHQNRFNKSIQKLRKALEKDRFGKLSHGVANIRWNRDENYYKQADWRGTWGHDGGALMNQCIHNIDLLIWMMNSEVDQIFAYTKNFNHPYIEGEDLGLGLIKFKNGSFGIIEGTVNVYPQNLEETLCIFGKTGTVKIGGNSVNKVEVWNFEGSDEDDNSDGEEEPPNIYGFGHIELYKDMVRAIRDDREPLVNGKEGKKALEVILSIYKSSLTGEPVNLPLGKFSTTDLMTPKFKKKIVHEK